MTREGLKLLSIAAVAMSLAAGAQAAPAPGPHLELARSGSSPLTVRGSHFRSDERVTVILLFGRSWTRTAVTDAAGRFSVRFTGNLPSCGTPTAHAFGSKGSRARTLPTVQLACGDNPTG